MWCFPYIAVVAAQAASIAAQQQSMAAYRAMGRQSLASMMAAAPHPCEYCQQPGITKLCTQCGAPRGHARIIEVCTRCGGAHPLSRCKWPP